MRQGAWQDESSRVVTVFAMVYNAAYVARV